MHLSFYLMAGVLSIPSATAAILARILLCLGLHTLRVFNPSFESMVQFISRFHSILSACHCLSEMSLSVKCLAVISYLDHNRLAHMLLYNALYQSIEWDNTIFARLPTQGLKRNAYRFKHNCVKSGSRDRTRLCSDMQPYFEILRRYTKSYQIQFSCPADSGYTYDQRGRPAFKPTLIHRKPLDIEISTVFVEKHICVNLNINLNTPDNYNNSHALNVHNPSKCPMAIFGFYYLLEYRRNPFVPSFVLPQSLGC